MKYIKTVNGTFLERPNRFIAKVMIDGKEETVHVKNTGRCKELLIKNAEVVLSESDNKNRKTKFDLIAVKKKNLGWVNIDSQAPNIVVYEWLKKRPELFKNITFIKPEYKFGNSRVDFYLEGADRRVLLEVKGCTLEIDGKGYFPDAPTKRGTKHLNELANAVKSGYECYIAFVIAMPEVTEVFANTVTDKEFAEALQNAEKAGVKVLNLPCVVEKDSLSIVER